MRTVVVTFDPAEGAYLTIKGRVRLRDSTELYRDDGSVTGWALSVGSLGIWSWALGSLATTNEYRSPAWIDLSELLPSVSDSIWDFCLFNNSWILLSWIGNDYLNGTFGAYLLTVQKELRTESNFVAFAQTTNRWQHIAWSILQGSLLCVLALKKLVYLTLINFFEITLPVVMFTVSCLKHFNWRYRLNFVRLWFQNC